MEITAEKISQSRAAGYSDVQIADFLAQNGYGDKIEASRAAGHSYEDIVRHLSGEKRGLKERAKQGMADFYLSTKQMGEYVGDKVGLGDLEIGTDGIKYINPEELSQRREMTQSAISDLEQQKGDAGFWAQMTQAAANPATWMGGSAMGQPLKAGTKLGGLGAPITNATKTQALIQAAKMGAISAGAYEMGLPQQGEFDPLKKAEEVATSAGIGAIAIPAFDEAVRFAGKTSPLKYAATKGVGLARGVVAPFGAGAKRRAEDRLKGLVADPLEAAASLDEPAIASALTPAQRTGEPGLLGMERVIAQGSPQGEKALLEQQTLAREQLDEAASGIGGGVAPQKTTQFLEGRRSALLDKANQDAQQAQQRAAERIMALAPERRSSEASVVVREEMESALRSSRVIERGLWEKIPKSLKLPTAASKTAYQKILNETPLAQKDDIPAVAKLLAEPDESGLMPMQVSEAAPKIGETVSASELQGLRSKLLEEGRAARAAGNYNKARIADNLADAVLDDLGAQAGNIKGPVGERLRTALDYSRGLNETYSHGLVGRILGSQRTGGERVAPELTLQIAIGAGKTKGSVGISDVMKAAGNSPHALAGAKDYVANQFQRTAVKDGVLNPTAARKFLGDNADVMDSFPDLRAGIEQAITAAESASFKGDRAARLGKSLFSKQQSKAAEFLGAPVDKEFDRIIKAQNPAQAAREISKMAAKDKTGEAGLGLKTSISEYLMGNANGSGEKLLSMLKDKRIGAAVREIYTADEVKMFTRIAKELSALESKNAKDVGKIMNDAPSRLIEYPLRMIAAKGPSHFGLGTIQASGMASQNAKNLVEKLHRHGKAEQFIIQAIHDPQLMKTLLMETTTPAQKQVAEKRLDSWIVDNRKKVEALTAAPVAQEIQDDE